MVPRVLYINPGLIHLRKEFNEGLSEEGLTFQGLITGLEKVVRSKPFLHLNYKFSVRLQNVKISKSYLFQYKLEEGLYLGGGGELMI